ncbi:MAG: glycosyltransferase family 2 protein [Actinomycetota bacterium]
MTAASHAGRAAGALASTAAVAAAIPAIHQGALTIAALRPHRCGRSDTTRFAVVVPAHDEAASIAETVASLRTLDHPNDRVRIVVVADNCTDETVTLARRAGAEVLERTDPDHRGKGQALHWAFPQVLHDPGVDAIVVVDADTVVDADLLARASHHLGEGAEVVQVDYRVRNPGASWLTTLLDVALTAHHRIGDRGRDALGLSTGLHGNGMVFSRSLLERFPYTAFSIVEDVEYGTMLAATGTRVVACDGTHVAGDMPDRTDAAGDQRVRWEAGRLDVRRRHLVTLGARIGRGDRVALGAAADLLAPQRVMTAALLAGSLFGAAARSVLGASCGSGSRGPGARAARSAATIGTIGLVVHAGLAVAWSDRPARSLRAVARVPVYAIWKLGLRRSAAWERQRGGDGPWVRSARTTSRSSGTVLAPAAPARGDRGHHRHDDDHDGDQHHRRSRHHDDHRHDDHRHDDHRHDDHRHDDHRHDDHRHDDCEARSA